MKALTRWRRVLIGFWIMAGSIGCAPRAQPPSPAPANVPATQETRSPACVPSDPYYPTRLDWLVLRLQAGYRKESTQGSYFTIGFAATDEQTVSIYVYYLPPPHKPDMAIMKRAVADAWDAIRREARTLGIEVDIREHWEEWHLADEGGQTPAEAPEPEPEVR